MKAARPAPSSFLIWLVLFVAFIPDALAAPGDLDLSFVTNVNATIYCAAVQPDGKIVIGGLFTSVSGVARNYVARLNENGTLDSSFDPNANGHVRTIVVQSDGKIVIVGAFTRVGGAFRDRIARLTTSGAVDLDFKFLLFGGNVYTTAIQADGKIIIGGASTNIAGAFRIARLNTDGALDAGFNPTVPRGLVYSVAVQADGRIVIGGDFREVGGIPHYGIARLEADGSLDSSFNSEVNNFVGMVAVQADGKIVIGGEFTTVNGVARNSLARLNANGTLDQSFHTVVDGGGPSVVHSAVVQADGKIIIGGRFTMVNGTPRNYLARLQADGTLDSTFNSTISNFGPETVFSMALQQDGKIIIGGTFLTVGRITRNLARLENDAATQGFNAPSANGIEWLRGGTSPEAQDVAFELSTDAGRTWTTLGPGARILGGWELTGLNLPANCRMRARARLNGGLANGSSGLVETVAAFSSVTVNLPRGDAFVLVANPLNLGTNTLNEILPNAPINTTKVYSFDSLSGAFQGYTKRSTGWQPADGAVFPPGKGFFVQNTSINPITLTFIGVVPEGTKTNYISPGFNLLGSQFLLAGRIEADFHLPARNGDRIYQFNTNSQSYVIYMRQPTGWNPIEPVIGFAEGFFLETTNAAIWTNSYSVPR